MAVLWRSFSGFVDTLVAAVVAKANATVDTSVGSITLAWAQAVGGVALWLQAENARVLALTRAATSNKSDLDSFYADFGFTRLGDVTASGVETFARYDTSQQALVLVGALVTTGPGGLQFTVIADTTNPAYNSGLGGYVVAVGVTSVNASITCLSSGSIGNVLANTIQSFGQAIPYIDTVTNPVALVNGVDQETDAAYRARFPLWLAGLQSSNSAAIAAAIADIQVGMLYQIVENYDYPGLLWDPGSFFVVVDDGSGTPSSALLATVSATINVERGLSIRYAVYPPSLVTVNVSMSVTTATGFVHAVVAAQVAAKITAWLTAASLDTALVPLSLLVNLAMNTAGVINTAGVAINGFPLDLVLNQVQRPMPGTVAIA